MDDLELIKMAGLAAGENYDETNNPLERDDLALRLAVKLEMDLSLGLNGCVVLPDPNIKLEELSSNDPYAATRRAIVRAAAEIGRTM